MIMNNKKASQGLTRKASHKELSCELRRPDSYRDIERAMAIARILRQAQDDTLY